MSRRKYQQDPQQKTSRVRTYDAAMIQDFITHLKTELRAGHLEATKPGVTNPELVEDLGRCIGRYQTPLRVMHAIERPDGMSDTDWQTVRHRYQAHAARELDAAIEHLEALDNTFKQALYCADLTDKNGRYTETVCQINAQAILDGSYFGDTP